MMQWRRAAACFCWRSLPKPHDAQSTFVALVAHCAPAEGLSNRGCHHICLGFCHGVRMCFSLWAILSFQELVDRQKRRSSLWGVFSAVVCWRHAHSLSVAHAYTLTHLWPHCDKNSNRHAHADRHPHPLLHINTLTFPASCLCIVLMPSLPVVIDTLARASRSAFVGKSHSTCLPALFLISVSPRIFSSSLCLLSFVP